MKAKIMKREAAVLLLTALMVFSSVTVVANTNISTTPSTPVKPAGAELVWDNTVGVHGHLGGIIVATVRAEGNAMPADDFQLDAPKTVSSIYWQGGYFQCQLASGQHDYNWDWRVYFWNDDGSGTQPSAWGTFIYNQTILDINITRSFWYNYTRPENGNTYWVANYSAELPAPITFAAGTKYWITIQGVQGTNTYPQACWCRHNDSVGGIKLHQAKIYAAYWGYPAWTDLQVLAPDGLPHDLNYQLFGGPTDNEPPYTTIALSGTDPVTVTLTAIDNGSGVASTHYKLDGGADTVYTAPFDVTGVGTHTVVYWSIDNGGNVEAEKTKTFTIAPPLSITIKGGFGITATIKNTGTTTLTNISWNIKCTGGLIIIGANKDGKIDSLAPAASAKAKDMVLGFGKTTIAVTAGDASASATGTVVLFFVLGVK